MPYAISAPATMEAEASLPAAFRIAHAAIDRPRPAGSPTDDPIIILTSPSADPARIIEAVDAATAMVPWSKAARRLAVLRALESAAAPGRPPELRARALTAAGSIAPLVEDPPERARVTALLLAALEEPAFRLYALRGLGPACHGMPEKDEQRVAETFLRLLHDLPPGEERTTSLTALYAFVATRPNLGRRKPAVIGLIADALLAPFEADVADAVNGPRRLPGSADAEMELSIAWMAGRYEYAEGDKKLLRRVEKSLKAVIAVEKDPAVRGQLIIYLAAKPPKDAADNTTKRAPLPRPDDA